MPTTPQIPVLYKACSAGSQFWVLAGSEVCKFALERRWGFRLVSVVSFGGVGYVVESVFEASVTGMLVVGLGEEVSGGLRQ